MDPLHVFAARQVPAARTSGIKDIDAFYDANAFESFHAVRRVIGHIAGRLRDACGPLSRKAPAAPEIARAAGRA
jgi:hypothetical protein